MKKILYFDTETTGLDPKKHAIIQIAGIVEIDGEVVEEFNLKCQPQEGTEICEDALLVHGYLEEQIMTFPKPSTVYFELKKIFDANIDKYDREDKLVPAGQNVRFDLSMLQEFFVRFGDKYLGSYLDFRNELDLLTISKLLRVIGFINVPNSQLETLAKAFHIELEAHDALSDVRATRDCVKYFLSHLRWEDRDA